MVLPNRWRRLANGKIWFLLQCMPTVQPMLSIMRNGPMGIHERSLAGIPRKGASVGSDINSGSGDQTLCFCVSETPYSLSTLSGGYGGFRAIIHPDQLDRLDVYIHMGDRYGVCRTDSSTWKTRKSIEDRGMSKLQYGWHYNEACLRRGISIKKVLRFVVSDEERRRRAIVAAHDAGIRRVNGMRVEDYIVVCKTAKDCYEKYVKPVVAR